MSSDLRNIIVTLVILLIGGISGHEINRLVNFDYMYDIKTINREYKFSIKSTIGLEKDIDIINQKLLSLNKNGGNRNAR